MIILIILLNCLVFNVRSQTHYDYVDDRISVHDKIKLTKVAKELIMDAYTKVRQVAEIRDDHSPHMAFTIGMIMGNIREKYRRMLDTYREMRDKESGRSMIMPSHRYKPVHPALDYIMAMEQVHDLETDIDKSIHIMESLVAFTSDPRYDTTTTPKFFKRADDSEDKEEALAKEENLKAKNRESGLLRRLGVKGRRHTSLPRFQHQWPVEDTWRLGQYGDLTRYY